MLSASNINRFRRSYRYRRLSVYPWRRVLWRIWWV